MGLMNFARGSQPSKARPATAATVLDRSLDTLVAHAKCAA